MYLNSVVEVGRWLKNYSYSYKHIHFSVLMLSVDSHACVILIQMMNFKRHCDTFTCDVKDTP